MKWRTLLLAMLAVAPNASAQLRFVYLDEPLLPIEGGVIYSLSAPSKLTWRSGRSLVEIISYPSTLIRARAKVGARIPPWLKYQVPGWRRGDSEGFRFTSREFGTPAHLFEALLLMPGPGAADAEIYLSWPALFDLLQTEDSDMAGSVCSHRHRIRVPQLFGLQPRTFDPGDYVSLDTYLQGLNLPVDPLHLMTEAGPIRRRIALQGGGMLYYGNSANAESSVLIRLVFEYMGGVRFSFEPIPPIWDELSVFFMRPWAAIPQGQLTTMEARAAATSAWPRGSRYSEAYFEAKEADARDKRAGPGSGSP